MELIITERVHFVQAGPRSPQFTIISQHAFLTSFSSIFLLTVKVREPTCPTKCRNIGVNPRYFCLIITVTLRPECFLSAGVFVSVMESMMAEIEFG